MSEPFTRTFHVRWGDLDFNAHMRNTAYLDTAVDVRMMYFQEQGFSVRDFEALRVGPVVLRDELEYFKEFHLLETMTVTLQLAGLNRPRQAGGRSPSFGQRLPRSGQVLPSSGRCHPR